VQVLGSLFKGAGTQRRSGQPSEVVLGKKRRQVVLPDVVLGCVLTEDNTFRTFWFLYILRQELRMTPCRGTSLGVLYSERSQDQRPEYVEPHYLLYSERSQDQRPEYVRRTTLLGNF
jgi:hypothetical protein